MQTDQKKKKPQIAKINMQSEPAKPVLNLSDNGSLILQEFRLNEQGLKVTHQQGQWDFSLSDSTHHLSLDNLVTVGHLGQGASGQVEKVLDQVSGQFFAMKRIPVASDPQYLKQLSDELKMALDCSSPYVVKCYGAFYKQGTLHIILEYMDVGSMDSLTKKVKCLNEPVMALLLNQILLGIDYLHNKKKIIHRDIKPQNILVNKKGEIKITDFGISSTIETLQQRKTYVGTAVYMSPERLNGEMYGKDSDIWSIGILTAECLIGKHPIQKTQFIDMVNEVSQFNIESVDAKISSDMKNFISQCVKLKPSERATVEELLNHKIIQRTKKIDKRVFLDWFCSPNGQGLYSSHERITKVKDYRVLISQSLYYKHGQSQNYYYSRPINQILRKQKNSVYVLFEDHEILYDDKEYIKELMQLPHSLQQLKQLIRYYKFSIDHPMLFFQELMKIIQKYIAKRSQIEYDWAINQIEKEQMNEKPQTKQKKRSTPILKTDFSCFLKDLSETQKSVTILNLLKNVEADKSLETDMQRQFTQSLIDQDFTKAIRFQTFIQQQEIKKKSNQFQEYQNLNNNQKKSLNLKLQSPRKSTSNNLGISSNANTNSTAMSNNNQVTPTIQSFQKKKSSNNNFHFFNYYPIANNNPITQSHHNNQGNTFTIKTTFNTNGVNSIKTQGVVKVQSFRPIEVPKLKIKLQTINYPNPKSERFFDRIGEKRYEGLSQRIKTQLDEPTISRQQQLVIKKRHIK